MRSRINTMKTWKSAAAFFCAVSPALGLFQDTLSAWTVDTGAQTITLEENESVNYSEFSSEYASYTIHLAEGSSVTHTAWIFNPLTGTGTFVLAPTGGYDTRRKR